MQHCLSTVNCHCCHCLNRCTTCVNCQTVCGIISKTTESDSVQKGLKARGLPEQHRKEWFNGIHLPKICTLKNSHLTEQQQLYNQDDNNKNCDYNCFCKGNHWMSVTNVDDRNECKLVKWKLVMSEDDISIWWRMGREKESWVPATEAVGCKVSFPLTHTFPLFSPSQTLSHSFASVTPNAILQSRLMKTNGIT